MIERFVSAYNSGRTPNPCIDCNRYMKFGKPFDRAQALDCGHVVTGHYARIEEEDGKFVLKKGIDGTKDQNFSDGLVLENVITSEKAPVKTEALRLYQLVSAAVHETGLGLALCELLKRRLVELVAE